MGALGPLSSAVLEAIDAASQSVERITLIGYSMGVLLLYKLLLTPLIDKVDRLVLIEPVVNCWIQLAAPRSLSQLPCLVLYGAHDDLVERDSKGDVLASVQRFLPSS